MKIAFLLSNLLTVPPAPETLPPGFAGAAEKIMYQLAQKLHNNGHAVTIYTSGDSTGPMPIVSVHEKATTRDPNIKPDYYVDWEYALISRCLKDAADFDIIHSSLDFRSAVFAPFIQTPLVVTLHSPITGSRKMLLSQFGHNQHYVSISNAQRKALPDLPYSATIYHGINEQEYTFSEAGGEAMTFVGRLLPEKGADIALIVQKNLGKPFHLLGTGDKESFYWKEKIEPYLSNPAIDSHGMVSQEEIRSFYQQSKCFLFPIQWEEPFGLVMIEAMSSGTPVVAFARGSVPEIVEDGMTGFLVNAGPDDIRGDFIVKKTGIEGFTEAVERVYGLSSEAYRLMRKNARMSVEHRFTIDHMAEAYEKVYRSMI